ncbi:MAG: rhodanese-like domain-containing protein [Campylobacterales bacterium]|jgi:rhodanese-related sulfurtransferase
MENLHKKLASYERYCDEAMLSEQFKALIGDAVSHTTAVTCDAVALEDPSLILIDVREPEEFASGFIPGKNTLTIPRGKLEFMALEKIAKPYGQNAPIITYCLKGPRGALAALQLQRLGFTNVKNLEGGMLAWVGSGRPIRNYLGMLQAVKD